MLFRSKTLAILGLSLVGMSLQGCLPEEVSLPVRTTSSTAQFSSFDGLVSAKTINGTKVQLSWNRSATQDTYAYTIYDMSLIFTPNLIKTVPHPLSETILTGLRPQTLYRFRVRASTREGAEDTNTRDLAVITYSGAIGATVQTSTSVLFRYSDASNAEAVQISCSTDGGQNYSVYRTVNNTSLSAVTLNNLSPGLTYRCRANIIIEELIDNNENDVVFTPIGEAVRLAFSTQPTGGAVGVPFASQPVVTIYDANDNIVSAGPDSTVLISLSLSPSSPTPGTLRGLGSSGIISVAAVNGVATFSGMNFQEVGEKILVASKADTTGEINGSVAMSVESDSILMTPGVVSPIGSTITLSPDPVNGIAADGFESYEVRINLADEFGNPIAGIKPVFSSSNLSDILGQPFLASNANGDTVGTISSVVSGISQISISAPSELSSVTADAKFNPGVATEVGFLNHPNNPGAGDGNIAFIQVAIRDSNGNVVTNSTAQVSLDILQNPGGGTLSGTTTTNAVNGIATFTGLGIDKTGIGYKLIAISSGLSPGQGNSFNVLAGTASQIAITGPDVFTASSSGCSSATPIRVELQDSAGNASGATINTTVVISGLGAGNLYTNSSCPDGAEIGSSVVFTTGSFFKNYYFKSSTAQETTLTIDSNPSILLQAGTKLMQVSANQIALSTPDSVPAGKCSAPLRVTTSGSDSIPGPVFEDFTVVIGGLAGSEAVLYSDDTCTNAIDPNNITFPAGEQEILVYLKDNKAEQINNITAIDLLGLMTPNSVAQSINVKASRFEISGPATMISGTCSQQFQIQLKDAVTPVANSVPAVSATQVNILGLEGTGAKAYTSCTPGPAVTSLTIPPDSPFVNFYIRNDSSEVISLHIEDASGAGIDDSGPIELTSLPSKFLITGEVNAFTQEPVDGESLKCTAAFTLITADAADAEAPVASVVTANLEGAGAGGKFYSDPNCENEISSIVFDPDDPQSHPSSQNFYFKTYGAGDLTLAAVDAGGMIATGEYSHKVKAKTAILGATKLRTAWFEQNIQPVRPHYDGFSSVEALVTDHEEVDGEDHTFLYVADLNQDRILKYDLTAEKYIGWIGRFLAGGAPYAPSSPSGSTIPSLDFACKNMTNLMTTPGWCTGGYSQHSADTSVIGNGGIWDPKSMVIASVDDTNDNIDNPVKYLYVAHAERVGMVSRFLASTGEFKGWIGEYNRTYTHLMTNAEGNPIDCYAASNAFPDHGPNPGWCYGGYPLDRDERQVNDWALAYPRAIAIHNNRLYVSSHTKISKYNLTTGAYIGSIGYVHSTIAPSPMGATSDGDPCVGPVAGSRSPGWCFGGRYEFSNSAGFYLVSSLHIDAANDSMYAFMDSAEANIRIELSTGHFFGTDPENGNTLGNLGGFIDSTEPAVAGNGPWIYRTQGRSADGAHIVRYDTIGEQIVGWIGRVRVRPTQGGVACTSLVPGAYTSTWCIGGGPAIGSDERSFYDPNHVGAMTFDPLEGTGILYAALNSPFGMSHIQKYDASTGAYLGSLATVVDSASDQWTDDPNTDRVFAGVSDHFVPRGLGAHHDGNYLYTVSWDSPSSITKYDPVSGSIVGRITSLVSKPTGGALQCLLSGNQFSVSPNWCLGGWPVHGGYISTFLPQDASGRFWYLQGITSDDDYLYVTDRYRHVVHRIKKDDGSYQGWIGQVQDTPNSTASDVALQPNATTCQNLSNGDFTTSINYGNGGWCLGGYGKAFDSKVSDGDAGFFSPANLVHYQGDLYILDTDNQRIVRFSTSGRFKGWIGAFQGNKNDITGCTVSDDLATGNWANGFTGEGWCYGGHSVLGPSGSTSGGFRFNGSHANTSDIKTDGNFLYITNHGNSRIDKYDLSEGVYLASLWAGYTYDTRYTVETWTDMANARANGDPGFSWVNNSHPGSIYIDTSPALESNDRIYHIQDANDRNNILIARDLSTGLFKGWNGAVNAGSPPSGGEEGCLGASLVTPGWCKGGDFNGPEHGYLMGTFRRNYGTITGDENFIYLQDYDYSKVIRIPKMKLEP